MKMKCLICKKKFTMPMTLKNLLKNNLYFICPNCYNAYPIHMEYQVLPLAEYQVQIFSLFDSFYYIDFNAFILEYSMLVNYCMKKHSSSQLLLFDVLSLNKYQYKWMEDIATICDKNLIVVCFYVKN